MIYKFDKIAYNSTVKKKPTDADRSNYIGLENIDPDSLFVENYGSDITPKGEKLIMKKGDVLFGKRRACQKKVAIAPCDGIFSAHGMVLRPKEDVIDKDFFPFFIHSDQFLNEAVRISVGGLSPTINWRDLKELEFSLPPLSIQRELSKKLWAAYRLKESYKKLLLATRDMVKSQFIEMFKGTFPMVKWEQCLTITNGKKYKGEYQSSGLFPICGSAGVMGYGDCKLCNKDTIILGRKGNINSPIYMDKDYWVVDTAFSLDVDKDKLDPVYFFFWCKQFDFTKYNKQGVLPSLTKSDLLTIQMPLPPMELQRQFVALYRQADKSEFGGLKLEYELKLSIEAINSVIKSLINN